MSKNFSARYYQKSKERLQKKAHENYQDLSEEEKIKSKNMVMNSKKIFLSMKNKGQLSLEKNIIKYGKAKPSHR